MMLPDPNPNNAEKVYNNPKLRVMEIGNHVAKMATMAKRVVRNIVLKRPVESESQPAVHRPKADPL